jgi:hypothetical protein
MPWNNASAFILQLHLPPTGKPEEEKSTIGFYLTDVAPKRALHMVVLNQPKIDIPPGEKAYRSTADSILPADVKSL